MISIANFFKKFVDIQKSNEQVFLNILSVIKEHTKINLDKKQIEIKGENIYLKIKPAAKNAIFMNKENIETSLKGLKIFLKLK